VKLSLAVTRNKGDDGGKRTVSVSLGTTYGQETMDGDGGQVHSRTYSSDSDAEIDERLTTPRIKAPANTPTRSASEKSSPNTKL
jgi:hypothetical protein